MCIRRCMKVSYFVRLGLRPGLCLEFPSIIARVNAASSQVLRTEGEMRFWVLLAVLLGGCFGQAPFSSQAQAGVRVEVSIASQTMHVYVNGSLRHVWKISSGRGRYRTPYGSFRPKRLVRMHYSTRYHGSPMPCSVFFYGGYAIHGTNATRKLGRPASHGCVRLRTRNACRLYSLVRRHGPGRTHISIY